MGVNPVPGAPRVAIDRVVVGPHRQCALGFDGAAYCWGMNRGGSLGVGDSRPYTTWFSPTRVKSEIAFVSLSLSDVGEAWCWKRGTAPARVPGSQSFVALTADEWSHACGLTAEGEAYCWGNNERGQLGFEDAPDTCREEYSPGYP